MNETGMNAVQYRDYLERYCNHDCMDEDEMTAWEWLEGYMNKCVQLIDGELQNYSRNEHYSPYRAYKSKSADDKFTFIMAFLQVVYYGGYRHRKSGQVPESISNTRLAMFNNNYKKVSKWCTDLLLDYAERARGQLENAPAVLNRGEDLKYSNDKPPKRKFADNNSAPCVF